tara:strand:+ start:3042 stop:4088 length:1047 start_codon:yes stop_codon:yes gene_type:complete
MAVWRNIAMATGPVGWGVVGTVDMAKGVKKGWQGDDGQKPAGPDYSGGVKFNYRYPNTQLEEDSDFLEIKVVEYKPPGIGGGKEGEQPFKLGNSTEGLQKNIEKPIGYIFLPVPENIQDSNDVEWGEDSINGLAAKGFGMVKGAMESGPIEGVGKMIGGTAKGIADLAGDESAQGLTMSFFASKAVNIMGGNTSLGGMLSRSQGQVLNPNMELLFKGVTLRGFSFDFDLAPRDKKEGETIKNIIRTFKTNMNARNSSSGSENTSGLFIKSPNVFQLTYKTGSSNHKFLHKFKPMALKNMSVNYTGAGTYATYDDTTPIHMKLSLSFQELNPIYAEDYEKDQGLEGVGY